MKNLTQDQFDRLVSTVRAAIRAGHDVSIANYPERTRIFEHHAYEVEALIYAATKQQPAEESFDDQRC